MSSVKLKNTVNCVDRRRGQNAVLQDGRRLPDDLPEAVQVLSGERVQTDAPSRRVQGEKRLAAGQPHARGRAHRLSREQRRQRAQGSRPQAAQSHDRQRRKDVGPVAGQRRPDIPHFLPHTRGCHSRADHSGEHFRSLIILQPFI